MKEMVEKAFASSQEAIRKAEAATEKRFESVNEFRAVLTDQQRHSRVPSGAGLCIHKLTAAISRNRDDLETSCRSGSICEKVRTRAPG